MISYNKQYRGEYSIMSENIDDNIIINKTELINIPPKNNGKSTFKKIVIFVLTIALVLTAFYGLFFAYWGRRHFVLYDVKKVTVQQIDEDIYDITYDVSAKNWFFDITPHTFRLEDDLGGEPGGYYYEGKTDYLTTGVKPINFQINVKFDVSTVMPYEGMPENNKELIKDVIEFSRFQAYDKNGKEASGAALYMYDNPNAEIVFVD